MKLLVCSDVHGEEVALDVLKKERKTHDAVLCLGDVVTGQGVDFTQELLSYVDVVIPGNAEHVDVQREIEASGKSVHLSDKWLGDVHVVGVGFSIPTPFHTPGERPEQWFEQRLFALPVGVNSILLTHQPAFQTFDRVGDVRVGSKALRTFLEHNTVINFCGHVHELRGVMRVGRSWVVKVGAMVNWEYVSAEVSKHGLESVEFIKFTV